MDYKLLNVLEDIFEPHVELKTRAKATVTPCLEKENSAYRRSYSQSIRLTVVGEKFRNMRKLIGKKGRIRVPIAFKDPVSSMVKDETILYTLDELADAADSFLYELFLDAELNADSVDSPAELPVADAFDVVRRAITAAKEKVDPENLNDLIGEVYSSVSAASDVFIAEFSKMFPEMSLFVAMFMNYLYEAEDPFSDIDDMDPEDLDDE